MKTFRSTPASPDRRGPMDPRSTGAPAQPGTRKTLLNDRRSTR